MSRIRLVALPRAVVRRAGLLRFRGSGMQVFGLSFQGEVWVVGAPVQCFGGSGSGVSGAITPRDNGFVAVVDVSPRACLFCLGRVG